jgi:hypothetical protein
VAHIQGKEEGGGQQRVCIPVAHQGRALALEILERQPVAEIEREEGDDGHADQHPESNTLGHGRRRVR